MSAYTLYSLVVALFMGISVYFGVIPNMHVPGMTYEDCVKASDTVNHMSWVWCEVDEEVGPAPSTVDSLHGSTQDETKAPEEEPQAL